MSTAAATVLAPEEVNLKSVVGNEDVTKNIDKGSGKAQLEQLDGCDIESKDQSDKLHDGIMHVVEKDADEKDDKLKLQKNNGESSTWSWKQKLFGTVNLPANEERQGTGVKILNLTIQCSGRSDVVLPIPSSPTVTKSSLFTLKQGCRCCSKLNFMVSENLVSGLKYLYTVWKAGVRVQNTKITLGTFSPREEPYTGELEDAIIPTGIFARGSYSVRAKMVDEDGRCYMDYSYYFEIRKTWE